MAMLMALGTGFHEASKHNMMNIANNALAVSFGETSKSYHGYPKGQDNHIKIDDAVALPGILPDIELVSTMLSKFVTLSYAGKLYNKMVWGVTPGHARLAKLEVSHGRFLNQIDVERHVRVAVISNQIKELFFGKDSNPLGEKFLINGVPFTLVGVLADKSNKLSSHDDVFISYRSYEELYDEEYINFFFVVAKPNVSSAQAEQSLRSYFAKKYNFDKNDKEAMYFWGSSEIYESIRWFLLGIQLFLSACGVMVLAVGGIGVANIMFLIVTERTYEIGLRKAIGATDKQIFLQLFFEVLVIIGIGGVLGMIMVFFTTIFLQHLTLPSWIGVPTLSWVTSLLAVFTLALIGVITGFFPAHRAAKLDPIEALLT
jgi:putative ABC transport system permease protein